RLRCRPQTAPGLGQWRSGTPPGPARPGAPPPPGPLLPRDRAAGPAALPRPRPLRPGPIAAGARPPARPRPARRQTGGPPPELPPRRPGPPPRPALGPGEIGRASWRERVWLAVGAVAMAQTWTPGARGTEGGRRHG